MDQVKVREALLLMVKTGMMAKELDGKMLELGYSCTPYSVIYGRIADAMYALIGEKTETFDESVTYTALNAPYLCDSRRADILMYAWRKNNAQEQAEEQDQPKPKILSGEELKRMIDNYDLGNGYMFTATSDDRKYRHQTPEGEWP